MHAINYDNLVYCDSPHLRSNYLKKNRRYKFE